MRAEKRRFALPLCCLVLICIYPLPYFVVQMLPGSLTQEAWFVASPGGFGGTEKSLVTYSKAGGLFKTFPTSGLVWEASLFAQRWYFAPIGAALDKMGWSPRYKYL